MTANQNHGFVFEDSVIKDITGYSKDEYQKLLPKGYVASMDIFKDIHSADNYSIKVMGAGGSIGCGDILRFYNHCINDVFYMVIGVWRQISNEIKRYDKIYEFKIEPHNFHKIWGSIDQTELEQFVDYVKSIPTGLQGQSQNKLLWKQKRNAILAKSQGHIVKIDAKIDSGSQRRVQCSIKIDNLIQQGIPYTLYTETYRGITLPYEQESPPRTRKKP